MSDDVQEDLPTTFAELPVAQAGGEGCRICGEPAVHRIALVVRSRETRANSGQPPTVASHKQDYCEAHAVALFVKIKKAMR